MASTASSSMGFMTAVVGRKSGCGYNTSSNCSYIAGEDSLLGRKMQRFVNASRGRVVCGAGGIKELRSRISSVKSTQKITDAMKLVAAAKVRRAQEAVVGGRPFSENLVKVWDSTCIYIYM